MPAEDKLQEVFRQLRHDFPAKSKRQFLADLEGQIEDDDAVSSILHKRGNGKDSNNL
jgi:hypothetical protein